MEAAAGRGYDTGVPETEAERFGAGGNCPVCAAGCKSRQSGGYSGYTFPHLPIRADSPPFPKNPEAMRAIFVARMAFSSFSTFRWLR